MPGLAGLKNKRYLPSLVPEPLFPREGPGIKASRRLK
jgi:hypothetical protein